MGATDPTVHQARQPSVSSHGGIPSSSSSRHHSAADEAKQDIYYFTGGIEPPTMEARNRLHSGATGAPQLGSAPAPPPPPGGPSPFERAPHASRLPPKDADLTQSCVMEGKSWDIFRLLPPKGDRQGLGFWHDASLQVLKLVTFGVLFLLSLGSAVLAKVVESDFNTVRIAPKHSAKWAWALFLVIAIPEVFVIETLHAIGVGIFVFRILPDLDAITALMLMNAVCVVPACLSLISRRAKKMTLIYIILDVFAIGAQSTIYWKTISPTLVSHRLSLPISLTLISLAWWQNFPHPKSALAPIRALAAFASRLNEKRSKTYALVSLWKCCIYAMCLIAFVSSRVKMDDLMRQVTLKNLALLKKLITITGHEMNQTQIQSFLSRMRALETGIDYTDTVIDTETEKAKVVKKWNPKEGKPDEIDAGDYAKHRRRRRQTDGETEEEEEISAYSVFDEYVELNQFTSPYDALWIVLVQVLAGFVCLASSKFACKVLMQRSGFALPMLLCGPIAVIVLASSCSIRANDSCYLTSTLTKELFWRCGDFTKSPLRLLGYSQTWMWLGWLLSQVWVTFHLWTPGQERLARSEKLFILPYFLGGFIESLALNRRRDDKASIKAEDLEMESEDCSQIYETIGGFGPGPKPPPSVCSMSSSKHDGMIRDSASSADAITKIYACATMWHETSHEMTCMLKSIFRMDEDQCARRNAQKYLKIIDPDYYEFEAHIFFDDAFDQNEFGEPIANKFVKQIVDVMDAAATAVHQTTMHLKPPKKVKTPYGGRFVYILPGKNRLIIHLKDKNRIRHRKRWSQVMYLYYLLGYRLMMKVDEQSRKEIISENTFILTLDGDVDFTPQCVHLLVDLMKKNRRLGIKLFLNL
ncbi:chs-2 [Pristionchus pacificus]|uniref:Chs-2 n=1 Tax=Pristionchus pacificus TaxID=54126 RepID=A0A2A6B3J8_PRIPA|nr:chs-2 [Pristionchus pacificus]|eukprot:PDM60447.1 chs-2 [Pristionchus pacificus]